MRGNGMLWKGALPGALAGLVGGIVFGAAMIELGVLPSIASLIRAGSPVVGFLVHMTIAALVGAGFGILVWHQRLAAGETLLWGLAYGSFFWFVGPITLGPIILGEPIVWQIGVVQGAFASLLGHVMWGAGAGLSLVAFRRALGERPEHDRAQGRSVLRGALAGLIAAWSLTALLPSQNELVATTARSPGPRPAAWLGALAVGLVAGGLYGALLPRPSGSGGPGLIRGLALGFLLWIVVALSILPLADQGTLAWSVEAARARFVTLPGYLLFGALAGLMYHWITALGRTLLSDDVRAVERTASAPQRLRAIGRGVEAGLVGGLIFTVVMIQVGALSRVASLIGAESTAAGFLVHMGIASFVGLSYGLLFRRQSFDAASGLGWGLTYGFLWWVLGPLTLFPVLLGGQPLWTASAAAATFPALIGHLVYGAGLGVTYALLEARFNPWWITRTEAEAARAERRREQVLTSAPALWAVVAFIAITIPLLLARDGAP